MVSTNMRTQTSPQLNNLIAELAVELQVIDRPLADKVLAFINSQPSPIGFIDYLGQSGRFSPENLERLQQEWFRRHPPPSPGIPGNRPSSSGLIPVPSGSGALQQSGAPPSSSELMTLAAVKADELLAFLMGKNWKLIPIPQLVEARRQQFSTNRRLGSILLEKGYVTTENLHHAAQMVYQTFAICGACGQTHDLRTGNPPACPACQGPWFKDSVEAMIAPPTTAVPTTPLAPIPGMLGPNRAPPRPNPSQFPMSPTDQPNNSPAPQSRPVAKDSNDPFSSPVGYQKGSQSNYSELLATSSLKINRKKFTPSKAPPPTEDSDELMLGLSTDELSIFSGQSGDDDNFSARADSSPSSVKNASHEKLIFTPPKDESPKPALRQKTTPKTGKASKQDKGAKNSKKKGCFGKSAALLILTLSIFIPIIAYAW
jgi:hypothetical protein